MAREDGWLWIGDKKGFYSVKSGYRMLVNNLFDPLHGYSSSLWNNIWSLQISFKVRNFLWRACRNCLPTKVALRSRYVDVFKACPVYNTGTKDSYHALVKCSFAKRGRT